MVDAYDCEFGGVSPWQVPIRQILAVCARGTNLPSAALRRPQVLWKPSSVAQSSAVRAINRRDWFELHFAPGTERASGLLDRGPGG